ncbi:unnamed protein product [Lactuca virosa]|uniref:Uncharacterized protein n=1 Tax=Lactuca virosa TaxID=75947 RepID=A0AAU9LHV6_9ASTR|nr:unnamed protein product [Lactuca virosa]
MLLLMVLYCDGLECQRLIIKSKIPTITMWSTEDLSNRQSFEIEDESQQEIRLILQETELLDTSFISRFASINGSTISSSIFATTVAGDTLPEPDFTFRSELPPLINTTTTIPYHHSLVVRDR